MNIHERIEAFDGLPNSIEPIRGILFNFVIDEVVEDSSGGFPDLGV